MDFLSVLVAFLASNNVLPAEITAGDSNREKTYLQKLPSAPDKAYCVKLYDCNLPTLADKQAGIYRIQVIMRNKSHGDVTTDIFKLWRFLISRPSYIEDIGSDYWVIFDVQSGPISLGQDEKGNYLYSLNFPVKTKMF